MTSASRCPEAVPVFSVTFTDTGQTKSSKGKGELVIGRDHSLDILDNHISRKQLRFYLADDKNAFVERLGMPDSKKAGVPLPKGQHFPVNDRDKFTLFLDEYPFELRLCLPGPLCDVREEKQVGVAVDGPPEPPFESLPERVLTEDEGSVDEGEEESDRGVSEESDYYGSSAADSPEDDEGREAQETEGEKLSRKAARPAGKAASSRKRKRGAPVSPVAHGTNAVREPEGGGSGHADNVGAPPAKRARKPPARRSAKPRTEFAAYRAFVEATRPQLQADYPHENERQISKLLKGRWSRMDDNAKKEFYGPGGRKT